MTETTMAIAVARYFGYRQNLIVPNVSFGLGLHECDLLCLTTSGYATEVEIKTSASDLKKDAQKSHGHRSKKIKYLYFAIPPKLFKHVEYIPLRAGILIVTSSGRVYEIAKPKRNTEARAFTDEERYQLARLGALRIWDLKSANENLMHELQRAVHPQDNEEL